MFMCVLIARARTSGGRGGPGRRAMAGESHEQTLANGISNLLQTCSLSSFSLLLP